MKNNTYVKYFSNSSRTWSLQNRVISESSYSVKIYYLKYSDEIRKRTFMHMAALVSILRKKNR